MKQKFVLKVQMTCGKCRTKALEIAASADGVNSVAIQGKDQDQVVVIGDGVDPISLVCLLRKKVGPTEVVTVEEVKPKDQKIEVKEPPYRCYPKFVTYEPVYEPEPPYCSIM
ncbi:hypothetical protein AAC387_Pa09g1060 [Persea americana]